MPYDKMDDRYWVTCGDCNSLEPSGCTISNSQKEFITGESAETCGDNFECFSCERLKGVCTKAKVFEVRKGSDDGCSQHPRLRQTP